MSLLIGLHYTDSAVSHQIDKRYNLADKEKPLSQVNEKLI